jgi:transcriptional regulator with XRE-family HTH domain
MTIAPGLTNGQAIERARLRNGWTQAELGRRANLDPTVISRMESGVTKGLPATRLAIANALGVDLDEISPEGPPKRRNRRLQTA